MFAQLYPMPVTPPHTSFIPHLTTNDYTYDLPEHRIAAHPLAERDASNLLIADLRDAQLSLRHSIFRSLAEELPPATMLVVNDSRVIAARILMQKLSGGRAEVLCLSPIAAEAHEHADYARALQTQGRVQWWCMVGGRKIQAGDVLTLTFPRTSQTAHETVLLEANILRKIGAEADVEFSWKPANITFAECLEACGHVPLPPYIKREDEAADKERYQTVYAAHDGSVAAPTAGLHFTSRVLADLAAKGIREERVTLHVGAGTFKPMTSATIAEHAMHEERVFVEYRTITALAEQLRRHAETGTAPIVAVGTTSMRTLESLYWWGLQLLNNPNTFQTASELAVKQWDAFQALQTHPALPAPNLVFTRLAEWMQFHHLDTLTGETGIMIAPGYPFQVCDGLITNFHQPESTLILLVAAFLTSGANTQVWRSVYNEALQNGYRFLSYGDSSLLWRQKM